MPPRKKDSAKKYFWQDVYIGSIPHLHAMLKRLVADMKLTNLQLLQGTPDVQPSVSQETLVNAMIVYFTRLTSGPHGIKRLEDELRESFRELSQLVADDMKRKRDESGGGEAPEGFSQPKGPTPGKKSPGPKGRSRNGRTAE